VGESNFRVDKFLVHCMHHSRSNSERQDHTHEGNRGGEAGIPLDYSCVNVETDKKEEEAQSDVGNKAEIRARGQREYVSCETYYSPKSRWA
jgi:hypothetical protein